jgi:hypothetical protein
MTDHQEKKSLSVMTIDELKEVIKQWDEDEVKEKDDGGCGHDQNEDYYEENN